MSDKVLAGSTWLIQKRLTEEHIRKWLLTEVWAGLRGLQSRMKHPGINNMRKCYLRKPEKVTVVEKPHKNGCPVGGTAVGSCSHSDCSHRRMLPLPGPWKEGWSQGGVSPRALQCPGKLSQQPEVREFGDWSSRGQLLWVGRLSVRMDLGRKRREQPACLWFYKALTMCHFKLCMCSFSQSSQLQGKSTNSSLSAAWS